MKLRYYQEDCIKKIIWSLKLDGNDLVSLPTGAGKSIIIAKIADYLKKDILILQPTQEILQQNKQKLLQFVSENEIGVYSASLKEKNIKKYTFATIGSIYKIPQDFLHFKIVIIDECHFVNPKEIESMYGSFLKSIGNPKVIGLSATLYRVFPTYFRENGTMYQSNSIKILSRLKEKFWSRILYTIDHIELLNNKFLCPIKYVDKSQILQEVIPLNSNKTDFDYLKYDIMLLKHDEEISQIIKNAEKQHNHVLVFCNSIQQSIRLQKIIENSYTVSSNSTSQERAFAIDGFKNGDIKVILNVGVLTTGFDMPSLDCIILLRPTRSIALYYQMLGRGVRIHKDKEFCTVYDWTDTVKKIGRIETIQIKKVLSEKGTLNWDLVTETGNWHGKELYKIEVKK